MDVTTIEGWVKGIGHTRDYLIAQGAIPETPLTELYKGRDLLLLEPGRGLELSFWAETKRLESVHVILVKTLEGMTVYQGELPKPFSRGMSQPEVRAQFGPPMETKPPTKLPMNTMIGGWDSYPLDPSINSNAKVVFVYAEDMRVKTITFTMIDKGHD